MKIYLVMGVYNEGEREWVQEAWSTRELAEEGVKALSEHPLKPRWIDYWINEVEVKGE